MGGLGFPQRRDGRQDAAENPAEDVRILEMVWSAHIDAERRHRCITGGSDDSHRASVVRLKPAAHAENPPLLSAAGHRTELGSFQGRRSHPVDRYAPDFRPVALYVE